MNLSRALEQQSVIYYTLEDIATALDLSSPSAAVLCNRKVRTGKLLRIRRNLYVLPDHLRLADEKRIFLLANVIQTPSYVSFTSALSYYGLTTQMTPSVIESTNAVRSRSFKVESLVFQYYYCSKPYFFGYDRKENFFIAQPEKALLDCLYMMSLGRYALDLNALNLKSLQWKTLEKFLKNYPARFRNYIQKWRSQFEDSRTT